MFLFTSNLTRTLVPIGNIILLFAFLLNIGSVNKDITGKRLIGWRSGDIRWSRKIFEIENFVLKAGFPIMYSLKDEINIFRTRQQLQVI